MVEVCLGHIHLLVPAPALAPCLDRDLALFLDPGLSLLLVAAAPGVGPLRVKEEVQLVLVEEVDLHHRHLKEAHCQLKKLLHRLGRHHRQGKHLQFLSLWCFTLII